MQFVLFILCVSGIMFLVFSHIDLHFVPLVDVCVIMINVIFFFGLSIFVFLILNVDIMLASIELLEPHNSLALLQFIHASD